MSAKQGAAISEPEPTPAAFNPGPLAEPPIQLASFGRMDAHEQLAQTRRIMRERRRYLALLRASEHRLKQWIAAEGQRFAAGFTIRRPIWTRHELGQLYCATASGSCLEPLIPDGARCYYELGATAHEGDIVLCELDPLMVERMRTDPEIIAANGRPTAGGQYVKRLAFLANWYFLMTNGSMAIIGDQDECRHRVLGVLRHVEIGGKPAFRSSADRTIEALRGPFVFDATITIGVSGSLYGYSTVSSYGSIDRTQFYNGHLNPETIAEVRWPVSSSALVRLRLVGTSIANDDRIFSSIEIAGMGKLYRSAATYTANDGSGNTVWDFTADTSGYPSSGSASLEVTSTGIS